MIKAEIIEHGVDRFMYLDNYLWMWDVQLERELQQELAEQAYGDVLVAGYGFGIVQKYLTKNNKVTSITTIEKYKEVIDYAKKGKVYGKIVLDDFYDYSGEGKMFDCIIGDIWPDIAPKFLKDYVQFKDKSVNLLKKDGLLLAWGKEFFEYLLENQK